MANPPSGMKGGCDGANGDQREAALELWQVLILAVVQGLTEFLPVSSSGHLVIGAACLGIDAETLDVAEVTIALHVGTLLAILMFYARRIVRILTTDRRLIGLLVWGTLPAVVVGVPIELWFEELLESPAIAGAMLLVTGGLLLGLRRLTVGDGADHEATRSDSVWIGVFQAAAVLPGLSRSGSTIYAGIWRGLSPKDAATFSFLLAVPAIAGAAVLKVASMMAKGTSPQTAWPVLAAGIAVSFVVGLAALAWLVRWVEQGRIWWFAAWCFPLGVAVLLWSAMWS